MSEANKTQVGGGHYKDAPIEHWDVVALLNLDYFQGQITKYVMRWREKGGIQDLEKSQHVTAKYIEVEKARAAGTLTKDILLAALNKVLALEDERTEVFVVREVPQGPGADLSAVDYGPDDVRGEGTVPSTRS